MSCDVTGDARNAAAAACRAKSAKRCAVLALIVAFACTLATEHAGARNDIVASEEAALKSLSRDALLLPAAEGAAVTGPPQALTQHTHPLFDTWHGWLALIVVLLLSQVPLTLVILLRLRRRSRWISPASDDPVELADRLGKLGFWRWDADTGRVSATDRCRRMFGFGPTDELTAAAFLDLIHPDDRAAVIASADRALSDGTLYDAEYRVILPGGIVRWIASKGHVLRERSDRPTGLVGISADVTRRKESEMETERREQELAHLTRVAALGTLSGSLAHELSQPLTAILSNAQAAQQLITRHPVDVGRIAEILTDIVDDDTRAGKIIEGLRTLLKKAEASTNMLDLNGLVAEVVALVRSRCIERSVALTVESSGDPAMVFGDRVQLQQVLLNLIMNACEAMETGAASQRRIVISIERMAGGSIALAVADTGGGISDALLPKLFQPFTSTKPQGMGLGLSISRSIVKAHGGTLCAHNNAAGGATLQLRLPAMREGLP